MPVRNPRAVWLTALFVGAALLTVTTVWLMRPDPSGPVGTVLITGANRGIGYALAEAYAERGWTVIATARQPAAATALQALATRHPGLRIEPLDITRDEDIAALAARLHDLPIDVLLNNAGSNAGGRGQRPGEFDYAVFDELMRVNAIGPLKMTEAFLPNVLASRQKKIVVISSIQASITRTFGGSYFYRASKAALNMMMRTRARDLEAQGVIVGILAPGVVATDMNRNLDYPMISPEESARGLVTAIAGLTAERSGRFLQYDGEELPW
jgi:NAD(P)-dependent dehydrogenase (short-subunit alcohol dehydrogenase family)